MHAQIKVTLFTNRTNSQSVVHSHPYIELILPISGSDVRYSVGGSLYTIPLNSLIYFPPNCYHSANFTISQDISQRIVVQIQANLWEKALDIFNQKRPAWCKDVVITKPEDCLNWDIKNLFERMAQTEKIQAPYQRPIYLSQIVELQQLISFSLLKENNCFSIVSNALIAKAVTYLQENFQDPNLNVTKLAQETFTSREYLSRLFKQQTTESIHSYLTSLRMQHCVTALSAGTSILDAYVDSGFSSYTSFLKTFRSYYGMTPKEYQLLNRPNTQVTKGVSLP